MFKILETCVTRSRTTLLILFMILMSGIIARLAIPVEYQPNIEVPFFGVFVPHEGISPEDAERLLVMPLELEIRQIEGLEEVIGYASEGSGQVMVEFNAEVDVLLFCFLKFGQSVGQPYDTGLTQIHAWFERVAARDSTNA